MLTTELQGGSRRRGAALPRLPVRLSSGRSRPRPGFGVRRVGRGEREFSGRETVAVPGRGVVLPSGDAGPHPRLRGFPVPASFTSMGSRLGAPSGARPLGPRDWGRGGGGFAGLLPEQEVASGR